MPHKSRYVAARTLIEEGWAVEKAMVEAADGSQRQGWKWTDPCGGVCHSFGKWGNEPTKPHRARAGATFHMKFKQLSPRNEVFLVKTLPAPCEICGDQFPERSLLEYASLKCCASCFARRKRNAEQSHYRKETFAARARAFMEETAAAARQNAPEIFP